MIVCVCRRISHREIESQANECNSFDELQMNTGISTACGRCSDCAQAVFEQARRSAPCIHRVGLAEQRLHVVV